MQVSDDAAKAVCSTDRAVVGSLGAWVAIAGPAEGMGRKLGQGSEESVLLLDSVPGFFVGNSIPNFLGVVSEVSVVGDEFVELAISPDEALSEHNNVISLSEGVAEVCDWLKNNLGVLSRGLVGGRAVVVPLWEVCERVNFVAKGPALGAEGDA